MTMRHFHQHALGLLFMACLAFFSSCYHWGAGGRAAASIALSDVSNDTKEGSLGATMRQKLQEQLAQQPGLSTKRCPEESDYVLTVRLLAINNSSAARSKIRDKRSREDASRAYQTVLYRIELKAHYELFLRADQDKPVLSREVTGTADLPRMHDRELPFQAACRQAADDAARKIVADIADQESLLPPAAAPPAPGL
jgi:hypothetical protein